MPGRRAARTVAVIAVGVIAVVGSARPASAHANLRSASPADGSVLSTGPAQIVLSFSEALSVDLATVTVAHADGVVVPTPAPVVGDGASQLVVTLPEDLAHDAYRVTYRVRDPVDLHLTTGSIVFGVVEAAPAAGGSESVAVQPLEAGLRWVEWCGLALAIGALALLLRHARAVADDERRRAVVSLALRLVCVGAVVAVVADGIAVVSEILDIGGSRAATAQRVLLSSAYGRRFVVAVQLAVALVVVVRLARPLLERRRGRARSALEWAPALLVAAMVASASYESHASTGGSVIGGVALRAAHLTGIGLWVGGLAAVVLALRCVTGRDRRALLQSFSPAALVGAIVTVASGLVLTGREVASITALARSDFGNVLVVKGLLVAIVLVIGARQGLRIATGRVARVGGLRLEVAIATVALGAGALLAALPPAVGERFSPPPAPSPATQTVPVGDLLVSVALGPNHPGRNALDVVVLETRRPSLGPIEQVAVTLTGADGAQITRTGVPDAGGVVGLAPVDVTAPGSLRIEVSIARPKAPVPAADIQVTVDRVPGARAATFVSDAPLRPWADRAALVLAATSLLAAAYVRRRRRVAIPPSIPGQSPVGIERAAAVATDGGRDDVLVGAGR